MLFITRVSGLGRDTEPGRALTLCQWKKNETSLDMFKSGGVKLMRALSRAKFPYDTLFSFYVHTAELVPSTLYIFIHLSFVTDGLNVSWYSGQSSNSS